jgi:hypothetical protein
MGVAFLGRQTHVGTRDKVVANGMNLTWYEFYEYISTQ